MALHGENLRADGETPAVRINGIEAVLIAWSATRNVGVVADDEAREAVGVVVGTPRGDTPAVEVSRVDSAAALMPRGGIVLARHADGSLVGRSGEFEGPWLGCSGRSGETLLLALTAAPGGVDLARVQVLVAGQACVVAALEEWGPGLQRLRIVLPELAAGDQPVRVLLDEKAPAKEWILPVR